MTSAIPVLAVVFFVFCFCFSGFNFRIAQVVCITLMIIHEYLHNDLYLFIVFICHFLSFIYSP